MIRLTVEQLHMLQERIQATGEVNATILPLGALTSSRLVIAWAKGRSLGEELYLSVWQNAISWDRARLLDAAEGAEPVDAVLLKESRYTHSYAQDEEEEEEMEMGVEEEIDVQ